VEPFAGLLTLTPNAWEIKPPERARVSTSLYIQLLRKIICVRFAQTCGAKISGRMSGSAAKKIVVNGATAVLLDAVKLSAKTSVRNGLGLSLIDDYRMIILRIPTITYLSNPECTVLYSEVLVLTSDPPGPVALRKVFALCNDGSGCPTHALFARWGIANHTSPDLVSCEIRVALVARKGCI